MAAAPIAPGTEVTVVVGGQSQKVVVDPFRKVTFDGVTYVLIEDDHPEKGFKTYDYVPVGDSTPGEVTLADSIDGIPVVLACSLVNKFSKWDGTGKDVTRVTLGKHIREIQSGIFSHAPALEEITIPRDTALTHIWEYSFFNSSGLRRIGIGRSDVMPASLEALDRYAFADCRSLQSIDLSRTQVTQLGDCVFLRTGLTAFSAPPQLNYLGASVFDSCVHLTHLTFPASLQAVSHHAFTQCTALSELVFEGGIPQGSTGRNGMGTDSLQGIHPDCVIRLPKPADEAGYQDALTRVYASAHGGAPASVQIRWSPGGAGQSLPSQPRVDLSGLQALHDPALGVTVDTASAPAEGCAAVVTISGTVARVDVEVLGDRGTDLYWSHGKAYADELGVDPLTRQEYVGRQLTASMKAAATRSGSPAPVINLNEVPGQRYGVYFYFPISTRRGSLDAPETSAIGLPVKVVYRPDETAIPEPEVNSCGNGIFYGLSDGEDSSMSNPQIIARGFETLFPTHPKENDPARVETLVDGVLTETASLRYAWLDAKAPAHVGTDQGTPLPNSSGYLLYDGYQRVGSTDDIIWTVPKPDLKARQELAPGVHHIYARVTLTVGSQQKVIYTDASDFYRFDPDLMGTKMTVHGDVEGSIDETSYRVRQGADVYCTLDMDYSAVPPEDRRVGCLRRYEGPCH